MNTATKARRQPAPRAAHATALVAAALLAAAPCAHARIKCWTNSEGVRECGNAVPPEYAQQGYEELNEQAIRTGRQQRAKTDAELEAEREAARRRAAEERRAREQRARDQVLLDTFSSVEDMELARDGRIRSIESQIRLTESQIEKLQASLEALIGRAANLERAGRPVPETLRQDTDSIKAQIARKEAFIRSKRAEQEAVRAQFARDIARYRELTADRD